MKHSIRVKFTMIFIGLMAAVLVSMWAVNSFFLELSLIHIYYAQIPPMYSALKVDGKKLYELARAGKEVERLSLIHI